MRKSRLGLEEQERLIKYFVNGKTARSATLLINEGNADEAKIDKDTVAYYFHRLRIIVDRFMDVGVGTIKFGYQGRGVPGREPIFGIIIQDDTIYTQVYPTDWIPPSWWGDFEPDGVVCADIRNKAVSVSRLDLVFSEHFTSGHSASSVDNRHHMEVIQEFWDQSKRHLSKFRGIPADSFPLFLRECEWRYMYSSRVQLNQLLIFARNRGLKGDG